MSSIWKLQQYVFMPQRTLALMLGVDQSALANAENGRRNFPGNSFQELDSLMQYATDPAPAPLKDYEANIIRRERDPRVRQMELSISQDEVKLPRLKERLEQIKKDFVLMENTRLFLDALEHAPEMQSSELKMSVINMHRRTITAKWMKKHPDNQLMLQLEIDQLEFSLVKRREVVERLKALNIA